SDCAGKAGARNAVTSSGLCERSGGTAHSPCTSAGPPRSGVDDGLQVGVRAVRGGRAGALCPRQGAGVLQSAHPRPQGRIPHTAREARRAGAPVDAARASCYRDSVACPRAVRLAMTVPEKLDQVPDRPGVYLYKDGKGQVIYIGKAASLRSRVRSYFQESRVRDPKTDALVAQISDLDYLVTTNELEALILESNLVKKHRPRYNIILRDDKHYPFLRLTTNEEFPRLEV